MAKVCFAVLTLSAVSCEGEAAADDRETDDNDHRDQCLPPLPASLARQNRRAELSRDGHRCALASSVAAAETAVGDRPE
jgi:hypothetical protein